jgi:hypothetical protein
MSVEPFKTYDVGKMTEGETIALAIACLTELSLDKQIEVIKSALDTDEIAELVAQLEG